MAMRVCSFCGASYLDIHHVEDPRAGPFGEGHSKTECIQRTAEQLTTARRNLERAEDDYDSALMRGGDGETP